jgi:RNA polymerase sigma factor (TIGR02999 family)
MTPATDTTQLLHDARAGHREAHDALWARLYDELRRIARAHLGGHAANTLSTTALVHEAYLRLIGREHLAPADRIHFLSLAARAMRFVLVERARARATAKRGGARRPVSLDGPIQVGAEDRAAELLALDEALDLLAARDERLARVVELRFFGGLAYEEVAEATGQSVPTAKRDWARARTWLYHALRDDLPAGGAPGEDAPDESAPGDGPSGDGAAPAGSPG